MKTYEILGCIAGALAPIWLLVILALPTLLCSDKFVQICFGNIYYGITTEATLAALFLYTAASVFGHTWNPRKWHFHTWKYSFNYERTKRECPGCGEVQTKGRLDVAPRSGWIIDRKGAK